MFRNVYGFALDDSRLRPLQDGLTDTAEAVTRHVEAFLGWATGEREPD